MTKALKKDPSFFKAFFYLVTLQIRSKGVPEG